MAQHYRPSNSPKPGQRLAYSEEKSSHANKHDGVQMKPRKLLLSIDYGTKTVSIAYRFFEDGKTPTPADVFDVHMSGKEYFAPQKAAWDKNGNFYWGYYVDQAMKKKNITDDDVFELWKLLLYKDHATSELASRIQKQLGHRDVVELITVHLQALFVEAMVCIKRAQTLQYTDADIDNLDVEVFLSVPQMRKPPANKIMTKAAKDAKIAQRVELVYEPQCAAAYYLHNIKDRRSPRLEVNDVILVADLGGGTGDFVSYRVGQSSAEGAKMELRVIAAKVITSALCGSEHVNQHFIAALMQRVPNFAKQCKTLGITTTTCIARASRKFEAIKQSFTSDDIDHEPIVIYGAPGAKWKQWEITITVEDIKGYFGPVIADIISCIDEQVTDQTKVLLVPGGFGQSDYLMDRLKRRYEPLRIHVLNHATAIVGAYQPVSRGPLLRYTDIKQRGLPSDQSFGITQVEEFDPTIHVDALYKQGQEMSNKRICRRNGTINHNLVEQDPYEQEYWIVYDRWLSLTKQGNSDEAKETFSTENWQLYYVEVGEKTMRVQVYWTENNIHNHEAMRVGDTTTPFKEGIEEYACLELEIPDLEALGFEQEESANGMVYRMYWRLALKVNGANIDFTWQLAKSDPDASNDEEARPEVVYPMGTFKLSEASYNPFTRQTVD